MQKLPTEAIKLLLNMDLKKLLPQVPKSGKFCLMTIKR